MAGLWFYDQAGEHARERLLASGTVQLLVDLVACHAFVAGPFTEAQVVRTSRMARIAGVVFQPGGVCAFVPWPVEALRDGEVPMPDLWGDDGRDLADHLAHEQTPARLLDALEAALLRRLEADRRPAAAMQSALIKLEEGQRVTSVASAVGLSRSTLTRRLLEGVGLSPKGWASLTRFQAAARQIASGQRDYAEVALDAGYYDQAHLIHDFRRYSGLTPARYRPKPGEPNHVVEP